MSKHPIDPDVYLSFGDKHHGSDLWMTLKGTIVMIPYEEAFRFFTWAQNPIERFLVWDSQRNLLLCTKKNEQEIFCSVTSTLSGNSDRKASLQLALLKQILIQFLNTVKAV